MKKTWIIKLNEEEEEKIIFVDSNKVTINGIPVLTTRDHVKRLTFHVESKMNESNHCKEESQQTTPGQPQQLDTYIVTSDFNLRSFGMDKQLYINNVNVQTGHVLNTRRKIEASDVIFMAFVYIMIIVFGFIITISIFPLVLLSYYLFWNNRTIIVTSIPTPIIPTSDFTIVQPGSNETINLLNQSNQTIEIENETSSNQQQQTCQDQLLYQSYNQQPTYLYQYQYEQIPESNNRDEKLNLID